MSVIAFGYRAGSGKDTAGKFLQEILQGKGLRCEIYSLADYLKEYCSNKYYMSIRYFNDRELKDKPIDSQITPRDLLIDEAGILKKLHGEAYFVNQFIQYRRANPEVKVWIIPDLRFLVEYSALECLNTSFIQVNRDNLKIREEENELTEKTWDVILDNNGSLENLKQQLQKLYS